MLSILKDFLLNLFFILIPIFIVPIWIEEKNIPKHIKRHLLTVCFALVIILCMTIPVDADREFISDLRQIPLWLGSLYKGAATSMFLCLVTIGYRSLFGGTGFFVTVIISLFIMVIGIALEKNFSLCHRNIACCLPPRCARFPAFYLLSLPKRSTAFHCPLTFLLHTCPFSQYVCSLLVR